jgi:hypothetical protein
VKDGCQQQEHDDNEIKDRKDAEAAASEESPEELCVVASIEENPSDQKAGEDKEEVHAHPSAPANLIDGL